MRLALGGGLLALAAACQTSAPLTGTSWRIVAIDGRVTPDNGAYRMRFERGELSGAAGCNHFGGPYRISGAKLTTGAMAMTEMACGEPANSDEVRALAIIQRPMTMSQPGASLTLANSVGTIELQPSR